MQILKWMEVADTQKWGQRIGRMIDQFYGPTEEEIAIIEREIGEK